MNVTATENAGMNFQLNRFYSMGVMDKAELMEIGRKATDFEKYRRARLEAEAPKFLAELQLAMKADSFIAEELKLYFESVWQ